MVDQPAVISRQGFGPDSVDASKRNLILYALHFSSIVESASAREDAFA